MEIETINLILLNPPVQKPIKNTNIIDEKWEYSEKKTTMNSTESDRLWDSAQKRP